VTTAETMTKATSSTRTKTKTDNNMTTIVRFKDIIGHQSVKLRLDEVLLPMALPPNLSKAVLKGIRSLPASILMYGPPGCGKVGKTFDQKVIFVYTVRFTVGHINCCL
jgi:ATP-dependent Zn protease